MPGQQPSTFNSPGQTGPPVLGSLEGQSYASSTAASSGLASVPIIQGAHNDSPQSQPFSLPTNTGGIPQLSQTQASTMLYSQPPTPMGMQTYQPNSSHSSLPALRPVFGVSLEDLLRRDGSAIPLVVYQCIQAVDLYGLEVEGIYRLSGSSSHVAKLKSIFDNG